MFKRNVLITIALATAISLSSAPCVQADVYETTLNLATPVHGGIDKVVLYSTTNESTGTLWGPDINSDLLGYSIELWGAGGLIYTDTVMVCGVVQPILGEVPRSNPWWHSDLDTLTHWEMNAGLPSGVLPATGTWYDVYDGLTLLADGEVNINCYKDGVWALKTSLLAGWSVGDPTAGQSTVVVGYSPVADAGGPYVGAVGSPITFDGTGSSDLDGDPLAYDWDFGGAGSTPDHTYGAVGIYDFCLTVTDPTCLLDTDCTFAVVYDPSEGFVTGGGWIYSLPGAYLPDLALEGKATFGFVSKYKKGANVPTGNTEFQFKAGGLNFHSSSYDWLLVTGSNKARFKGTGTINGSGAYKFHIWAGDDSPDTFQIRIWTEDQFGVEIDVYDNSPGQAIGGGSIKIHTK